MSDIIELKNITWTLAPNNNSNIQFDKDKDEIKQYW